MIKVEILPKTPGVEVKFSYDAEGVEISIYIDRETNILAYYKNVFWSKLMDSKRRKPISLSPTPSSALSHQARFQTISNG